MIWVGDTERAVMVCGPSVSFTVTLVVATAGSLLWLILSRPAGPPV